MSYYSGAYQKRLKRFGSTPQDQLKNKRSKAFDAYRAQSAYAVDVYIYNVATVAFKGVLEPRKTDNSETTAYLLTDLNTIVSNGNLYTINSNVWMVISLDHQENSGYNRYLVLKMNYLVSWSTTAAVGTTYTSPAYFHGEMSKVASDLKRSANGSPIFEEQNATNYVVMPSTLNIHKDDYMTIAPLSGIGTAGGDYLVESFDTVSISGVIYVKVGQTMTRASKTVDATSASQSWLHD